MSKHNAIVGGKSKICIFLRSNKGLCMWLLCALIRKEILLWCIQCPLLTLRDIRINRSIFLCLISTDLYRLKSWHKSIPTRSHKMIIISTQLTLHLVIPLGPSTISLIVTTSSSISIPNIPQIGNIKWKLGLPNWFIENFSSWSQSSRIKLIGSNKNVGNLD